MPDAEDVREELSMLQVSAGKPETGIARLQAILYRLEELADESKTNLRLYSEIIGAMRRVEAKIATKSDSLGDVAPPAPRFKRRPGRK